MIPILLSIGSFKIYSFGVFLAFALLWSLFVLWKQSRLTSYKEEDIFDAVFWAIFGGAFISRLFYVAFHFKDFGLNFLKFILVNGYPGGSLIGFMIGFYVVFALVSAKKGIPPMKILDYTATPFLVALSLGKIGSFLGGVDVGTLTKLPVGVMYVGYTGLRHIVAFYEAVFFLLASYISSLILLRIRRSVLPYMMNFFWLLVSYGLITILLDKFKENHLYFLGMSFSLMTGILALVIGLVYFAITQRLTMYRYTIIIFRKINHYGGTIFRKRNKSNSSETPDGTKKTAKSH